MSKKNKKDLPAKSDVTRKDDDTRFKQQDEYATPNSTNTNQEVDERVKHEKGNRDKK